jgi:single-stranded DNA-binding protein
VSLHLLATGTLVADPIRRTGARGDFATALMRVATEDGAILVSMIAFGEVAETLLAHRAGATLSVAGRAKLSIWTGRDGRENHGLALVGEQVASASAARRDDIGRRQTSRRTTRGDTARAMALHAPARTT